MMVDSDLLSKVRELRAGGRTRKQIAQTLGVRPAVVAPLVRTVARQEAAKQPRALSSSVGDGNFQYMAHVEAAASW